MAGMALLASASLGAGQEQLRSTRDGQLGSNGAAVGATSRDALTGGNHAASGSGVVEAKDERVGTVTISGEAYLFGPNTRFFDKTGEAIPVQKLPVARVFRDEPQVDTSAIVAFEATETARGWILESVRVQGRLPQ
jgi:hypothetical protein